MCRRRGHGSGGPAFPARGESQQSGAGGGAGTVGREPGSESWRETQSRTLNPAQTHQTTHAGRDLWGQTHGRSLPVRGDCAGWPGTFLLCDYTWSLTHAQCRWREVSSTNCLCGSRGTRRWLSPVVTVSATPRLLVRKCPHLASPALGPSHAIAVTEPRSVTATLAVIPGRGGRCVLLWRPLASAPVDSGAAPS